MLSEINVQNWDGFTSGTFWKNNSLRYEDNNNNNYYYNNNNNDFIYGGYTFGQVQSPLSKLPLKFIILSQGVHSLLSRNK